MTDTQGKPSDAVRPVARLSWDLYVECPSCGEDFNIVDHDSDNDYSVAKKVFTNGWDKVEGHEVTCPKCEHEFELGGIEY